MRRKSPAAAPPPAIANYGLAAALLAVGLGTLFTAPALIQWPCLFFLAYILFSRSLDLLPAAALLVFLYVGGPLFPEAVWALPGAGFLLPVLLAGLVSWPFPRARAAWDWLRRGHLSASAILLAAVTAAMATAALLLWALWADYLGVGAGLVRSYRDIPRWFLLLVGVPAFALVNAFAEEAIFRGVLQGALLARFPGRPRISVVLPAALFAAAHYWAGFPNGKIGLLMTFIYGISLGMIRLLSRGFLLPFLTHFAADFVIGILLVFLARGA